MSLGISWNCDKVLSDPLTSGKLYYRKPFSTTNPLLVGTVSDIAPVFSVSHDWGEIAGGNWVADVLSKLVSGANELVKSLSKARGGFTALATGGSTSSKWSNLITGDLNNNFYQYTGSTYDITLPKLIVNLLPTDRPEDSDISDEDTPAGKLKRLMSYQANQDVTKAYDDGDVYDPNYKVGPSASKEIEDEQKNQAKATNEALDKAIKDSKDNNQEIVEKRTSILDDLKKAFGSLYDTIKAGGDEVEKLNDTKIIGSSAYFRNQILTIAPFNFRRGFDYTYPVYLRGTASLVVNGIIYRNLLIKDISAECSKTRLISVSKSGDIEDKGPSWIKIEISFQSAIKWTVRDIEDLILQLSNTSGYSQFGTKNGNIY